MKWIKSITEFFSKDSREEDNKPGPFEDTQLSDRQKILVGKVKDIVNGKEGWGLCCNVSSTSLSYRLVYRNAQHCVTLSLYAMQSNPTVSITLYPDNYNDSEFHIEESFVSRDLSDFLVKAYRKLCDERYDKCLSVLGD